MSFKIEREKAGMTQLEAAKMLGVSQPTIACWETGRSNPRFAMLNDIAKLFGCTVDDLMVKEEDCTSE